MTDVPILELSKRIENSEQLMDLGIKGLKLPEFKIKAALYDHPNSIQTATHDILSVWLKQQPTRQEAYTTLYRGLKEAQMHQLATILQKWVHELLDETSPKVKEGM